MSQDTLLQWDEARAPDRTAIIPGEYREEFEPITDGWQGFLNKIRGLFRRPLKTRKTHGYYFDPPLVIEPGESVTLEFDGDKTRAYRTNEHEAAKRAQEFPKG